MVCDNGVNKTGPCLEQNGVPDAAAQGVWRRDDRCPPAPSVLADASDVMDARQSTYNGTEVCPHCGGIKDRLAICPRCGDTGEVSSDTLPHAVRGAARTERITAVDLAAMVSGGESGALSTVRAFPGVAGRLDDRGRRRLFEAARRRPMMALLGRTPDALVEAGGADILAAIAEEKPRLARRSLRASAILGLDS
jgi:hypothetical protein